MEKGLTSVKDLGAFLEGAWDLTRSIEDRLTNAPGRLVGRAVFVSTDGDLFYEETGRLMTSNFDDEVHQSYVFRLPEPHLAQVQFSDGRDFHDLDLRTGRWRTRHDCDPDTYNGSFQVVAPETWLSEWIIKGPRKDMTIRNSYSRSNAEV